MLHDMFNQAKLMNNMPTASELQTMKSYEDMARAIEDSVVGDMPGFKQIARSLHGASAKNMNAGDILRGVTFKHILGMWSPDQVLIQMSGAIVSFAVSPMAFSRALPQMIGFGALDFIRNMGNKTLRESVEYMKSIGLEEYTDGYELWYKSGFYDSVMHSHADYNDLALFKNLPVDDRGIRTAIGSHTMFYRAGELANTRAAFFTAYQEYKSLKGISKVSLTDKEALSTIKTRAEQLRLNMTKANQSDINKGLATVPLQFKQVIVKYFEKMLPKAMGGTDELTGAEKFRLMAFPTAAYGVAGAPGGDYMMEKMYEMMGRDMADVTPEESSLMRRGLMGWAFNFAFDMNVDMSTRLGLGTDFSKAVREMITSSYNWTEMLGPVSNVARIYGNNFKMLASATQIVTKTDLEFPVDKFQFASSVLFDAISDIPKLGRNGKKYWAYFMTDNPAMYKNGQYVYDATDMNTRTAVMAMLGMQLTEEGDLYEWSKEVRDMAGQSGGGSAGFLDDTAEILLRIANVNILGSNNGDQEGAAVGEMVFSHILQSIEPQERMKVIERMNKLSLERKLDPNNLLNKMYDTLIDDMKDGVYYYNEQALKAVEARK